MKVLQYLALVLSIVEQGRLFRRQDISSAEAPLDFHSEEGKHHSVGASSFSYIQFIPLMNIEF